MIIDLILDRKDGQRYNAQNAYNYIREEEACFNLITKGGYSINISAAMDGGTNEDVQRELCKYITANGYAPEICDYINSVNWIEDDTVTIETVRELAQHFLNTADKYAEQVSAYIDGDNSDAAAMAYAIVRHADREFIDALNKYEGHNDYEYGLNYDVAESLLPAA